MAKFETVDDYRASLGDEDRAGVDLIRAAIRAGAPDAEEVISYGIPAFKFQGWLYYVSAHTAHFTLSAPPPNGVWDAFQAELKDFKRSKSALQLPKSRPLPLDLVTRMTAAKAAENAAIAAAPRSR